MLNVHELSFHGELDAGERWRIDRQLGEIEQLGDETVTIIDLTDVRYVDTVFLNALARIRNRTSKKGFDSRICVAVPPRSFTSRLFEITNLTEAFAMFDDMHSARRYARFLQANEGLGNSA